MTSSSDHRATIEYDEENKRVLIGYSDRDPTTNERTEHWVGYTGAEYTKGQKKGGITERACNYKGCGIDAPKIKWSALNWESRIPELNNANKESPSKDVFKLWEKHFGELQLDASKAAANKKRRATEAKRRSGNTAKKPRGADGPRDTATPNNVSDVVASSPTTDPVDSLRDAELMEVWYRFREPMSDRGITRCCRLLQDELSCLEAPPFDLVKALRGRGSRFATKYPKLILEDPELRDWIAVVEKRHGKRAPSPADTKDTSTSDQKQRAETVIDFMRRAEAKQHKMLARHRELMAKRKDAGGGSGGS